MNLHIVKIPKSWKRINIKGNHQCLYSPVILIYSVYRKDKNYYPKVLLEKYYFIEDIKIYYSNSNEEYYDEECIKLLLEIL